jgi:hypothetical protein
MGEEIRSLVTASLSAGAIVLAGGCYALFLALGRMRDEKLWPYLSTASFACLVAASATLTWSLQLRGIWLLLVGVLLVGYFAAPRFIWRLSVATHNKSGDGFKHES